MKHFKRWKMAATALVLSAGFLLGPGGYADFSGSVVYADEKDDIKEIERKQAEREKKKQAAQDKLKSLNIEANNIRDIIQELDNEIYESQENIRQLTAQRNAIQAEIAVTESNLQIAHIAAENQYDHMKERIAYAYENGEIQYMDALMALEDFSNIINQSEYVEQVSIYDQNQLSDLIAIRKTIQEQEKKLTQDLAEIEDIKADAEAEKEALLIKQNGKKEKLEEYSYMIYDTRVEVNDYQKLIEEGDAEIRRLEAEYKRKQEEAKRKKEEEERKRKEEERRKAEAARAAEKASSGGSSSGGSSSGGSSSGGSSSGSSSSNNKSNSYDEVTPTYSSTGWRWPCPASRHITSYFGYRTPPVAGATSYHSAIDIGVGVGNSIVAAAAGRVMYTSYSGARGNFIRVDHGGGITTLYQHLSGFDGYSSGDYVEAGTVIAYSGMTGICAGPHLHFEVWVNGTPVNPLNYVSP